MARSYKKNNIIGMTCKNSEKRDKQIANRKLRKINKQNLSQYKELKFLREVSNVWGMSKDGKRFIHAEDFPKETFRKLLKK